jgi:hypothetical protein
MISIPQIFSRKQATPLITLFTHRDSTASGNLVRLVRTFLHKTKKTPGISGSQNHPKATGIFAQAPLAVS